MELLVGLSEDLAIPLIINIHDVELAKRYTTRVIGLSKGGIVYDGPPSELTNDNLKEIYGGASWLQ